MILVEVAGNLGADAEERFTNTGKRVISLRIAARVRKDETVWWRVNIWGDRFDKMLPYFKKGTGLIIVGEMMSPETYVDKEGNTRVSLTLNAEIVKFSPFGRSDRSQQENVQQPQPALASASSDPFASSEGQMATYGGATAGGGAADDLAGDDLPF